MQSAVLAMIDSICLFVRPSACECVTIRYHVKIIPAKIMRSSLEDIPMTLVSSRLTSPRNSKGNIESGGTERDRGRKRRQFLANKTPYLRNGAKQDHSHNDGLIGRRIRAFDWYQNYRPWMNLNG